MSETKLIVKCCIAHATYEINISRKNTRNTVYDKQIFIPVIFVAAWGVCLYPTTHPIEGILYYIIMS